MLFEEIGKWDDENALRDAHDDGMNDPMEIMMREEAHETTGEELQEALEFALAWR